MNWLNEVVQSLVPPTAASGGEVHRWRWMLVVVIILIIMSQLLHLLDGYGVFYGDRGFVRRDEFMKLRGEQAQQSRRQLESLILETRERQCRAMRLGNSQLARETQRRLTERRSEYYQVVGREFPVPPCIE